MDKYKLMMIIVGVVLFIVGIISTRVKKNSVIGIRIPWSMYNENTWKKSNRFGGIVISITGIIILISAFVFSIQICMVISVVVIIASLICTVVKAKMIFDEEKARD